MLDLLLEQCPLLVVFRVTSFLKSGDFLLLFEGGVHALGDFLLFAGHVLPQLVQLVFRVKFDPLSLFESLGKTFSGGLLTGCQFCLLLLNVPQFRVESIVQFAFFIFDLSQVLFQLDLSLLGELGLEHEVSLGGFVEKVGPICQSIIAKLLSDALGIWTLGTFFDEVI